MNLPSKAFIASVLVGSSVYGLMSVFSPHGRCVNDAAALLARAEYREFKDRADQAAEILCNRNAEDAGKAVASLQRAYR